MDENRKFFKTKAILAGIFLTICKCGIPRKNHIPARFKCSLPLPILNNYQLWDIRIKDNKIKLLLEND